MRACQNEPAAITIKLTRARRDASALNWSPRKPQQLAKQNKQILSERLSNADSLVANGILMILSIHPLKYICSKIRYLTCSHSGDVIMISLLIFYGSISDQAIIIFKFIFDIK